MAVNVKYAKLSRILKAFLRIRARFKVSRRKHRSNTNNLRSPRHVVHCPYVSINSISQDRKVCLALPSKRLPANESFWNYFVHTWKVLLQPFSVCLALSRQSDMRWVSVMNIRTHEDLLQSPLTECLWAVFDCVCDTYEAKIESNLPTLCRLRCGNIRTLKP